ncbi:hypothetical protein PMIN06_013004 [Paraphaeosphaeria minitans]
MILLESLFWHIPVHHLLKAVERLLYALPLCLSFYCYHFYLFYYLFSTTTLLLMLYLLAYLFISLLSPLFICPLSPANITLLFSLLAPYPLHLAPIQIPT